MSDLPDRRRGRHSPGGAIAADGVIRLATFLALAVALLAALGSFDWRLELLAHFRLHAALGTALLLLYWIARRKPALALLAAAVAVLNAVPMLPYVIPASPEAQAGPLQLRVLSANVGLRNVDYAALERLIAAENPDLVGLQEVDRRWIAALSALRKEYPHAILRPEEGAYGLALFSRLPLTELGDSPYSEDGVQTAIGAQFEVRGRRIDLMLVHLMAPMSRRQAGLRDRQIRKLASSLGTKDGTETILIGDLNTTPWSPRYRPLETDAGLRNAGERQGYHATWPARLGYFGLPIDHCLLSEGLQPLHFRSGAAFGSDHRPILVDIVIRETSLAAGGKS